MEDGKDRWKLEIYQEDSIPLLLNLVNIPKQIINLEVLLFPRMELHFLKPFIEKRYRECIRLILANLLLASQRNKCLYYSRSSHTYRQIFVCKENRDFSTLEKVIYIMDKLEELKLIDQFLGFEGPRRDTRRRTRVKVRQEFLNYVTFNRTFIPEVKQSDHKKSFIILKNENKESKNYSRRDVGIRQIENDIVKINNKYTNIKLTLELPIKDILSIPIITDKYNSIISKGTLLVSKVSIKGNKDQKLMGINTNSLIYLYNTIYNTYQIANREPVNYCNNLKKLPMESILVFQLDDVLVKRVFNEDFLHGGRFYGPRYQTFSSEIRKYLYIDGQQTVELDYSGLHLRILYNGLGLECPENPYGNLEGKLKEIFKVVCFIGLNAKDETKAIHAIVKNVREKFGRRLDYDGARTLLETFKELHKPISKFFHEGYGIKLQWADSTLMNRILLRLINDCNTVGLPVHDSIIVQKRYKENLRQIMEEEYKDIFRFIPIIK